MALDYTAGSSDSFSTLDSSVTLDIAQAVSTMIIMSKSGTFNVKLDLTTKTIKIAELS